MELHGENGEGKLADLAESATPPFGSVVESGTVVRAPTSPTAKLLNKEAVLMLIDTFTGGLFDTNSFFLMEAGILIDAPQDAAAWLADTGHKVNLLLLTHGHIDHVWDAARIQREHGCKVGYHLETEPMVTQPDFSAQFGFPWEIEPITPGFYIDETESLILGGIDFKVLFVPGHCPGSLCFLWKKERVLFGGDVLFAGSIGRTDLPGGDFELLASGIREKVYPLGDEITVLPGHGPATKIGIERQSNPYVPDRQG